MVYRYLIDSVDVRSAVISTSLPYRFQTTVDMHMDVVFYTKSLLEVF